MAVVRLVWDQLDRVRLSAARQKQTFRRSDPRNTLRLSGGRAIRRYEIWIGSRSIALDQPWADGRTRYEIAIVDNRATIGLRFTNSSYSLNVLIYMADMTNKMNATPEELVTLGEQIYFENKDSLEKKHFGEFAVIEVESKEIITDRDKLKAIQQAQKKYPNRLFYIVQIGKLKSQFTSEMNEVRRYGWTI